LSVGLPITQLELATIAFVVCALIMYILWWNKPFGVERRITITATMDKDSAKSMLAKRLVKGPAMKLGVARTDGAAVGELEEYFTWLMFETRSRGNGAPIISRKYRDLVEQAMIARNQIDHRANLTLEEFWDIVLYLGIGMTRVHELMEVGRAFGGIFANIFGKSSSVYPPRKITTAITFFAAATLFSAFHIGAWNWEFPSSTVQNIWRSFAVAATSTGPLTVFLSFVSQHWRSRDVIPRWRGRAQGLVLIVLLLVYVLSRLGLIVIIFYCFSSMPAGIYMTVDWTKYLPYFS
jgi:hypothetical protein